jgi:hypothetical protein
MPGRSTLQTEESKITREAGSDPCIGRNLHRPDDEGFIETKFRKRGRWRSSEKWAGPTVWFKCNRTFLSDTEKEEGRSSVTGNDAPIESNYNM